MQSDKLQQKAYYDSRWQDDLQINSLQMERCAAILEQMSKLELRSPRILDFGCGNGWLTSILSHFGEAEGVDLSAQSAIHRFPALVFHEADLTNWNVAKPYDLVVSQEVLEHIEVQCQFVDVAADVLKRGGHLILTTPNARITSACTPEWRKNWLQQPIENVITAKQLHELLSSQFRVLNITSIILGYGDTLPYRLVASVKLRRSLNAVGALPIYDSLLRKMKLGLHLLAVAQKL